MQPYCNPTRKVSQDLKKKEQNLNLFQMEDNLNILVNGRRPQKHLT